MLKMRPSAARGHFNLGWLNTFHTFSFGEYYDPKFMGHGVLRVINDDTVQPNNGFPMHDHKDMEIITYVISGALEHRDNMGNGSIIKAGDVQYMSAGTGVSHSEFNPSDSSPVHLLQIWIIPKKANLHPHYDQRSFAKDAKLNQWCCMVAGDRAVGAIEISAAATIYASILQPNKVLIKKINGSRAWLQVISGKVAMGDQILQQGDGVALDDEVALQIKAEQESELLLIEC